MSNLAPDSPPWRAAPRKKRKGTPSPAPPPPPALPAVPGPPQPQFVHECSIQRGSGDLKDAPDTPEEVCESYIKFLLHHLPAGGRPKKKSKPAELFKGCCSICSNSVKDCDKQCGCIFVHRNLFHENGITTWEQFQASEHKVRLLKLFLAPATAFHHAQKTILQRMEKANINVNKTAPTLANWTHSTDDFLEWYAFMQQECNAHHVTRDRNNTLLFASGPIPEGMTNKQDNAILFCHNTCAEMLGLGHSKTNKRSRVLLQHGATYFPVSNPPAISWNNAPAQPVLVTEPENPDWKVINCIIYIHYWMQSRIKKRIAFTALIKTLCHLGVGTNIFTEDPKKFRTIRVLKDNAACNAPGHYMSVRKLFENYNEKDNSKNSEGDKSYVATICSKAGEVSQVLHKIEQAEDKVFLIACPAIPASEQCIQHGGNPRPYTLTQKQAEEADRAEFGKDFQTLYACQGDASLIDPEGDVLVSHLCDVMSIQLEGENKGLPSETRKIFHSCFGYSYKFHQDAAAQKILVPLDGNPRVLATQWNLDTEKRPCAGVLKQLLDFQNARIGTTQMEAQEAAQLADVLPVMDDANPPAVTPARFDILKDYRSFLDLGGQTTRDTTVTQLLDALKLDELLGVRIDNFVKTKLCGSGRRPANPTIETYSRLVSTPARALSNNEQESLVCTQPHTLLPLKDLQEQPDGTLTFRLVIPIGEQGCMVLIAPSIDDSDPTTILVNSKYVFVPPGCVLLVPAEMYVCTGFRDSWDGSPFIEVAVLASRSGSARDRVSSRDRKNLKMLSKGLLSKDKIRDKYLQEANVPNFPNGAVLGPDQPMVVRKKWYTQDNVDQQTHNIILRCLKQRPDLEKLTKKELGLTNRGPTPEEVAKYCSVKRGSCELTGFWEVYSAIAGDFKTNLTQDHPLVVLRPDYQNRKPVPIRPVHCNFFWMDLSMEDACKGGQDWIQPFVGDDRVIDLLATITHF